MCECKFYRSSLLQVLLEESCTRALENTAKALIGSSIYVGIKANIPNKQLCTIDT